MTVQIAEFRNFSELAALRPIWDSLWNRTPNANFFQSCAWFEAFGRHFGADVQPRVLLVENNSRPVGILPFIVRRERTRLGRMRVLTYPLDNWGSFFGPVGTDSAESLRLGLNYITDTTRDWDFVELRWLSCSAVSSARLGSQTEETVEAMHAAGLSAYPTVWDRNAFVRFPEGWSGYLATRKGAWLRRIRQSENKLRRQGTLRFVRYRPAGAVADEVDPRWDLYDACEKIAAESWQARSSNGTTLCSPSVRDFLRETHEEACRYGAADLALLYLDERPAAYIYGYASNGYAFGMRRGFSRDVSPNGLGEVLLFNVLQDSAARGDRIYDMGVGAMDSKRHFLTDSEPIMRVSGFASEINAEYRGAWMDELRTRIIEQARKRLAKKEYDLLTK